ncbi:MAG: hypothetical protein HYT28_00630 [Parcubacteria group bacterium]|nr:hypothetical protein [Parcubacteria group bacterium]
MTSFFLKKRSRFLEQKNRYGRADIITAARDWKTLLIIAGAIAFFIVIWNTRLFSRINDESLFQERVPRRATFMTIDRIRLEKVLETFKEKAARFDELSQQAPKVADPSISALVR